MNTRWASTVAIAAMTLAIGLVFAVRPARAAFGISAFDQQITSDPAGDVYTQAGGHPYDITTEVDFNSHLDPEFFEQPRPDADVKDVVTNLPPGLIGNPDALEQCTEAQLLDAGKKVGQLFPECPVGSVVGTIQIRTDLYNEIPTSWTFPVYNMVPPSNMPAMFGFQVAGEPITIGARVRNGGDFGVIVESSNIQTVLPLDGLTLTFWGVPGDPSHDSQRCDYGAFGLKGGESDERVAVCNGVVGPASEPHALSGNRIPFLRLPTSCTAPGVGLSTNVQIDSWPDPGVWAERDLFSHLSPGYPSVPGEWGAQRGTTGCDIVPFNPGISVEPTNHQADTPSGLNVEIALPQEGLLNPQGIATSDVRKTVVTLPAGESISPSAADGLGACSLAQIGLKNGLPAACPDSSKLGTIQLSTPALNELLVGSIYLGQPECAPCNTEDDLAGRMVKMYIVVEGHGLILKMPGRVELDPTTGRIVTTFDDIPQLPFDHLKLNFKAGPRSPLVNPHACGTYQTNAVLTPWSGNPPAELSSSFQITSGPNGSPCPGSPQPFNPSFVTGATNNQAGAFSPLTVAFGRADGEQQLGGVTVKTPPGLLGSLSAVSLCPEPAASNGSCPGSSEIGSLTVAAGAGANPFYVTGGKVFLTGGYKGAQFGLSIVVPAKAGPFDLGTVIVRGSVAVDPTTTALTVTTDPLPTILDGIPLDLRMVHVNIGKSGFIFNPTNCDPLSVSGSLTGGLGSVMPITNSFQVTNCGALAFKPSFKVSTAGRTNRANGASLDVKLSYSAGSMGTQSNLAKVKVDLPKQLPSRLTTLQKACPDSVFDANPAACPPASRVGQATATTPIIPEALSGPAFFVSHGGAKFPELIIALSGYGVTVYLHGETFINKAGITSSTFRQVPDVPIGSFELRLPEGSNSALAANGNLCASTLKMPTAFVAQDGAEIHRSTSITATGCGKAKHARKASGRRKGQDKKKR
jgi:hypothetical protein